MARSAEEMVTVGWIQIALGAATIFGLFVTLYYTRRSVRAAEAAVAEHQRIGETEIRAYLHATSARITHVSNLDYRMHVKIQNTGQTAAADVSAYAFIDAEGFMQATEYKPVFVRDEWNMVGVVPPGAIIDVRIILSYIENAINKMLTFPDRFDRIIGPLYTFRGCIRYTDVFGKRFRSDFVFTLRALPDKLLEGVELSQVKVTVPVYVPAQADHASTD